MVSQKLKKPLKKIGFIDSVFSLSSADRDHMKLGLSVKELIKVMKKASKENLFYKANDDAFTYR